MAEITFPGAQNVVYTKFPTGTVVFIYFVKKMEILKLSEGINIANHNQPFHCNMIIKMIRHVRMPSGCIAFYWGQFSYPSRSSFAFISCLNLKNNLCKMWNDSSCQYVMIQRSSSQMGRWWLKSCNIWKQTKGILWLNLLKTPGLL